MGFVMSFSPVFLDYNPGGMTGWLITSIVAFAIVFAINSSIHSFLVVKYAKSDKVAVSVGFYYMSNALGRLMGTLGSGFIFTYVGEYFGEYVGHDGTAGLAACYFAGTLSSAAAAFITTFIDDNEGGLKCGNYTCVHASRRTLKLLRRNRVEMGNQQQLRKCHRQQKKLRTLHERKNQP